MDPFCKIYVESDLASLHYTTFIEPFAICPMEALSFDSDQFMNNSINKVIKEKINDHFLLLKEYFFTTFLVYNKAYEFQFEDMFHEVL
jgi:hypothetical protein